jgi:hypothetical protein
MRHRQFKRLKRAGFSETQARTFMPLCERCATALLEEVAHNEDVLLFAGT